VRGSPRAQPLINEGVEEVLVGDQLQPNQDPQALDRRGERVVCRSDLKKSEATPDSESTLPNTEQVLNKASDREVRTLTPRIFSFFLFLVLLFFGKVDPICAGPTTKTSSLQDCHYQGSGARSGGLRTTSNKQLLRDKPQPVRTPVDQLRSHRPPRRYSPPIAKELPAGAVAASA
jgi:hypothetical protein